VAGNCHIYRKRVNIAYRLKEKLELTKWVLLKLFKTLTPSAVHLCHLHSVA